MKYWLLVVALCCCCVNAETFERGLSFYQAGKFPEAHAVFSELAQLGNEQAQFNIGVMHLRGEFLPRDTSKALAWVSLARENGSENAGGVQALLEQKLTAEEKQEAQRYLQELRTQYGTTVISHKLMPIFKTTGTQVRSSRRSYFHTPEYPKSLSKQRTPPTGWVDMQYVVGKDGSTRYFKVVYAPVDALGHATLEALKQSTYEPASTPRGPTLEFGKRHRLVFKLAGSKLNLEELQNSVKEQKEAAQQGTTEEKLGFAYSLVALHESYGRTEGFDKIEWENSNVWFIKAAQSGAPLAKYQLGLNTLNGDQCDVDYQKSLLWLTSAANDNVLDAQFALGYELIAGVRFEQNMAEGKKLLQKAADFGLPEAQVLFAWLLATHPDANFRSTPEATLYLAKIDPAKFNDQRSYHETATAVALGKQDWKAAEEHLRALAKINEKYQAARERETVLAQALVARQVYLEAP